MAFYVMDSSALIGFLRQEVGAEKVAVLLQTPQHTCIVHAINLCEVFYIIVRDHDETRAQQALDDLELIGLITNTDFDDQLWQTAGRIKAQWRRVSLADCFGIALSQRLQATFVTADHHELDTLTAASVVKTLFIR